ncbi:uncharacterized protein LOC129724513 [Wyeomyia smithii]|uniref:uncharacterized protein LOC129724513 n=1 Tax=Wyeomyia smithii TaxID=174621 RepID=UPI002467CAC1|nr:uncharacterized protein LOC129724513 [Wyeomyia smithii]
MTERGICYTVNSALMEIQVNTTKSDNFNARNPIKCSFNKYQCFMKIDSYDSSFSYAIHSPYELTTSETIFPVVGNLDGYVVSHIVQETIANAKLRDLSIKQRNCIFFDEEIEGNKFQSYNICVMRCRAIRSYDRCRCVPHFYPFLNEGPTCTLNGLLCLSKHPDWYDKKFCYCLKPCTEVVYVAVQTSKSQWTNTEGIPFKPKSSLRWEVLQPKTQFRRDVLFGFEDLLVSFGGCISLFMGQNLVTIAQLFQFLLATLLDTILKTFQNYS